MKKATIPRLELLGAVLLSRLTATVSETIPNYQIIYWTDSTTVMYWIRYTKPWKQYISNRVQEIHQLTNKDSWRHCPRLLNPDDMPTWGLSGIDLAESNVWWTGSNFLKLDEKEWPLSADCELNDDIKSEVMKQSTEMSHVLLASSERVSQIQNVDKILDRSSFISLLQTMTYVLQFIKACRKGTTNDSTIIAAISWPPPLRLFKAGSFFHSLLQNLIMQRCVGLGVFNCRALGKRYSAY